MTHDKTRRLVGRESRKILRYLMIALSTIFLMAGGVIVFESVDFKPYDGFSFNAVEYCQKNIGNIGDLIDQEKLRNVLEICGK